MQKIGICLAFLLCSCSSDPTPEEEFEAPTFHFPLLGHVPDRPSLPEPKTLAPQKEQLKEEHDRAIQQQNEILKSTKS